MDLTITEAKDWPMFLAMMKLLGIVICAGWAAVISLIIYIWKDLKKRISTQRSEDRENCASCKSQIWRHIEGPVWDAIENCCHGLSAAEKCTLRDNIKFKTGACDG